MKILCTAPTFVPSLDGPTYIDINEVIDVEPDTAKAVVVAGKGLYVDKKDDPTKGNHTATDRQLAAAKDARAEAKRAAAEAAKTA